ncbi:hypothetical protein Tco_0666650 [Tanacetum coccineum]
MANFAAKYSIMTQEMVDSFCDNFYIPVEVHPTAPGHGKTITQFPVVIPAAGGSSSAAAAEVSAPTEEGQEDVAPEEAYLELADPDEGTTAVRQSEEEVVTEQPQKVKKKRLLKQSDVLPAKKLRVDHPTLVSGSGGKTLAGLEQIREAKVFWILLPKRTSGSVISLRALVLWPEESEGSDDSFYEPPTLDPFEAKRWSRAEHELELKEKLRAKYAARVSSLSGEKSALTTEVSELKVTVTQKDHAISLLDSRATCLASTLDDAKVACAEAEDKITSLASERDRLASEEFKEKMEIQQEEQAQELFNRVAELEAHLMDEGLEASYEHGVAGRNLSVVDAYNPKVAKASYIKAVKALEDVDFPLVNLLKSKKDARMDEVLDCFLLNGPLTGLPEAAYLQPCIEQLSIPIHHVGDNTAVGETSLSFALMNVHARAEGAKKHDAALRQLMMEIVSAPLSSQTWVGEASTSVAPLSIEDYDEEDMDEALGSVIAVPKLETCRF